MGHVYYGNTIQNLTYEDCCYLAIRKDKSAGTVKYYKEDHDFTLADQMQEYPVYGTTDFHEGAIDLKRDHLPCYLQLSIKDHEILYGKEIEEGVPQTRNCQDVETLKLTLNDPVNEVTVTLFFSIYKNSPVIVRKNRIQNDGNETIWALVTRDRKEVMIGYYRILAQPNATTCEYIKLPFLDKSSYYEEKETGMLYNGSLLKEKEIRKPSQFNGANESTAQLFGDYQSKIIYLTKRS
ncbi:glycoside hydrolase family 36 N-terminal domain-containing protein [Anaerostipes sp. MSJ-23]|uniref:glycoside hydrolase family 36 N-terminal domain-containing protein n=1 Tax=Anaerostipes sp. MSJ-23 TaxID=2841520 RepID=UPI002ED2D4F7